jgi:protein-L-isoaspartate(D-aspartate) O-methyltransferase
MRVLEIGTGSGYQAAVLAKLCRRVYTVERHKALLAEAEKRLRHLHVHNVTAIAGDGIKGWPEQAPFDRILVTAATPEVPRALLDQLAEQGVMVLPVGAATGDQVVVRVTKKDGRFSSETLMPVRFVPLVGGEPE